VTVKLNANGLPINVNIGLFNACVNMEIPGTTQSVSECKSIPPEISQVISNFSTLKNLYIVGFSFIVASGIMSLIPQTLTYAPILLILGGILCITSSIMLFTGIKNIPISGMGAGDISFTKSFNAAGYIQLISSIVALGLGGKLFYDNMIMKKIL
jgi:hypothetical protein